MVDTDIIETEKGAALGIKIKLQKGQLLIIRAEKGYMVCGYFDPSTIEQSEDIAVIIRGVCNWDEMLSKKLSYVSTRAKELGINENMTGKQALNMMI